MTQSSVHLLDLPNEILSIILRKLDNVNVLYSLFAVINERFDRLLQNNVSTNTLHLVSISSTDDEISSLDEPVLNRFCTNILPRIHPNVTHLTLESMSMERILLAGNYPNLTYLKLFNFGKEIALYYFKDQSIFQHMLRNQITELVLQNNDNNNNNISLENYTRDVYVPILTFFQNLKNLSIIESSTSDYPPLSIRYLPSTSFYSEILTELRVDVCNFDDCLHLLNGRLKQLTTFIVRICHIRNYSWIVHNTNDLPTLKCFSLTSYHETDSYDNCVIPLLHRMSYLEKLTLYIRSCTRTTFIDGTDLHTKILIHMPRLESFYFYISTETNTDNSVNRLSDDNIQQTFTNIGYDQMACCVNYYCNSRAICHVFSLPFVFDHLEKFCNKFPPIKFDYITCLTVADTIPFYHEFFIRITHVFPLLKYLSVNNNMSPLANLSQYKTNNIPSYSIIEYPNLISLDIRCVDNYYIEQFLLDTKTYAPRLTEIEMLYEQLKTVSENFTRNTTRHNCANVKRLIFEYGMDYYYSKELLSYFPSL